MVVTLKVMRNFVALCFACKDVQDQSVQLVILLRQRNFLHLCFYVSCRRKLRAKDFVAMPIIQLFFSTLLRNKVVEIADVKFYVLFHQRESAPAD